MYLSVASFLKPPPIYFNKVLVYLLFTDLPFGIYAKFPKN